MKAKTVKIFFSIVLLTLSVPSITRALSPYQKYAILNYEGADAATMEWINNRFGIIVHGNNPGDSSKVWAGYYDLFTIGSPGKAIYLNDWANANSVVAEKMFLHAKKNYTSTINPAWSFMWMFDVFEYTKGIMRTANEVSYVDLTQSAYRADTTWQDTMYIGYEMPFDQINLIFSTFGSGVSGVWEYWNGSIWAPIILTDGTSAFSMNGQIYFSPPSDWAKKVVNGSRNKYFVRYRMTAATVKPVSSSIKGDDWLNGGPTQVRGWSWTDPNRINQGTPLEYNPNPPSYASAKFPYQARITTWSSNHFAANPSDYQMINGVNTRTWSMFWADRVLDLAAQNGWNAIMGDDGEKDDNFYGIYGADTDFVDTTTNTWTNEIIGRYRDAVAYVKSKNPNFKVGLNGQLKSLVLEGDWNLAEYHTLVWRTANPRAIDISENVNYMSYDQYLPSNNPTGKFGLLIYADTRGPSFTTADANPGTVVWDRANRGPIVALSKHLIAANENTYFAYYTTGGYNYYENDKVVLKDESVVHMATQPTPPLANIKRWATWFPAMGVDMGIPDVNGWNGGARSYVWKSHTEIGGIQDVWRRDYTNAIILHRPAVWNTSANEYNIPSPEMALGGTYYPLYADGTTGPGVTSIVLRAAEGAILMKAPLGAGATDTNPPSAPSGLSVQ